MADPLTPYATAGAFTAACFASRDERSIVPTDYNSLALACKAFGEKLEAVATYPRGEATYTMTLLASSSAWQQRTPTSLNPDDYTAVCLAINAAITQLLTVV